MFRFALIASLLLSIPHAAAEAAGADAPQFTIERITTIVPFPRGLEMIDGELYILSRGRVRGVGGVSAEIEDRAGTIFISDPDISEPVGDYVSDAVRNNGRVLADPTDPPFKLWDRTSDPPESDTRTDRPYCVLRFHEPTQSFYICAFSGIDLPQRRADGDSFSKNHSDAILRYDLRTGRWYEVERHDPDSYEYPHADPETAPPPHGWLKGPHNILPIGNWLYAVSKDNSLMVRYDLSALVDDPEAPPPPGELVLTERNNIEGRGEQSFLGHAAMALHDGWLYLAYRTSSVIVRFRIDQDGLPVQPIVAQLIARFDPWDPATGRTADLTDIAFDSRGRLYVVSAEPARIFRFTPDPQNVFDARDGRTPAWLDLAAETGNPRMKSENIFLDDNDRLYITSGDGYSYQGGADGTVYRITPAAP